MPMLMEQRSCEKELGCGRAMLGAWEENSIDLQKPEAQRVLRMNTQKKIIGK